LLFSEFIVGWSYSDLSQKKKQPSTPLQLSPPPLVHLLNINHNYHNYRNYRNCNAVIKSFSPSPPHGRPCSRSLFSRSTVLLRPLRAAS